eukprot:11584239-Ditylum_brightwellii.AAC.1
MKMQMRSVKIVFMMRNYQKIVSEEPHGVACVDSAGGDWEQISTEATQATLNSVMVKEKQTIPTDVFVPNTE